MHGSGAAGPEFPGARGHREQAPIALSRAFPHLTPSSAADIICEQFHILSIAFVITSYSIHYTKLYELRKKLAAATDGDNYIETVWGRGYVLRDPTPAQESSKGQVAQQAAAG